MATTKYLQLCACVTRLLVWWPPVWCGNSRRTLAANNHHHSENITRNRSIIVCCTGSINNSNLHSYSIRLTVQIKMQMLPCSHIQPSSATHTHAHTQKENRSRSREYIQARTMVLDSDHTSIVSKIPALNRLHRRPCSLKCATHPAIGAPTRLLATKPCSNYSRRLHLMNVHFFCGWLTCMCEHLSVLCCKKLGSI